MSRAGLRRTLVAVVVASLVSLVSLVSCAKGGSENLPILGLQPVQTDFVADLAPNADTVHINFFCATTDSVGLVANGKTAWNHMRRRKNPITWVVASNVTINSIKGKTEALPIDTVQGEPHGGGAGNSYRATVDSTAGVTGPNPGAGNPKDRAYAYELDLTCTAGANNRRLVIDPELIVRRP